MDSKTIQKKNKKGGGGGGSEKEEELGKRKEADELDGGAKGSGERVEQFMNRVTHIVLGRWNIMT